jgi:hypothetical protein
LLPEDWLKPAYVATDNPEMRDEERSALFSDDCVAVADLFFAAFVPSHAERGVAVGAG